MFLVGLGVLEVERVGVREDEEGRMSLLVRAKGLKSGDPLVVSSLSRAASGSVMVGREPGCAGWCSTSQWP